MAERGGDDHVVFVGVRVKDAVAVVDLFLHEYLTKFKTMEIDRFTALVGVRFGEYVGVGETECIFDAGEGLFAALRSFFAVI